MGYALANGVDVALDAAGAIGCLVRDPSNFVLGRHSKDVVTLPRRTPAPDSPGAAVLRPETLVETRVVDSLILLDDLAGDDADAAPAAASVARQPDLRWDDRFPRPC